jgi:lipopolysaccharide transport system permease protein
MSYAHNTSQASVTDANIGHIISKDKITISDFKLALDDVLTGIASYKFWTFMGLSEIRRRYRRTIIGPFWTTLSLGLFIGCMGYLLSSLWHSSPKDFLPYFCSGYISWILIQTTIMESCTTFTSSESYIKQVSLPYTNYACLIVWRNIIVFMHHLVILAIVLWYAGASITFNTLLVLPALGIFFITGTWIAVFLGMICSRFRDIQQIVTSLLQLAMFVTPILWTPEQLGARGVLVSAINPLYHFITIIRLPLIGQAPSLINWVVSIGVAILGSVLTFWMFSKNYKKLIFWL